MTRTTKPNTAGHPSPQGVEKYGGIRKAKIIVRIKRDIPPVIAERYGIPISMHIENLIIQDENGKRLYSDIYWIRGAWKDHKYNDAGAERDIEIVHDLIKATISQYNPKNANMPKIPVEIEVEKIEYDWEMGKLWRFEVIVTVRYHWENVSTMKLSIKFPSGEIYTNSITKKVYWDNYIVNSVAEFLLHNDPFNPQTYLRDALDI